jgi:hypothetical protein
VTSFHTFKYTVYFAISNDFYYRVTVFYIPSFIIHVRRVKMELSRYKTQFATQMDVLYSTFAFISARGVASITMARICSRFSEGNKMSKESNIAATRFQKLFTHVSFSQSQDFSYSTIYKQNCLSQGRDMAFFSDTQTKFCISHRKFICRHKA